MSDDRTNDTDLATDLAAQVWCAPECSECVMDVRLATEFARVLRNWLDFAEQQQRNATYYRGIVQEIGEPFGIESRTSDDGSVQDEVLILKVTELVATLRTQLAAMTAERDELQTSMDELRKACAEVIGADPQTWPDHGNAPLAIAASLGLRSIELDRATAERDNWKETSVTIAGELADTKDERDAAMAKVVVLRDALVESVDQMIGDAMSIEWECGDCRMLEKMEADHDLSPAIYLARNALEATK